MTTLIALEVDDELPWWTLQELLAASVLEAPFIVECVTVGLVEVDGEEALWRFDAQARRRLERAWRLHHDLDVQVGALPLVLELLDERDGLRRQVQALQERLARWEYGQ